MSSIQQQSLQQSSNHLQQHSLLTNLSQMDPTSSSNSTSSNLIPLVSANLMLPLDNNGNNSKLTTQMLINTNTASMMMTLSPSKPSNISELSNSSMLSSGSSTLDSSTSSSITTPSTTITSSSQAPKRVRAPRTSSSNTAASSMERDKDGKYLERRKRNNVAAKKSRDARKQREDEIAIRASYLEKENSILKAQLQTLKDEAQQLRILLAQKKAAGNGSTSNSSNNNCANCSNCSALAAAALAAVSTSSSGSTSSSASVKQQQQQQQPQSNQMNNQNLGYMSHHHPTSCYDPNLTLDIKPSVNQNNGSGGGGGGLYMPTPQQTRHQIM
jgi:hypothetical protein